MYSRTVVIVARTHIDVNSTRYMLEHSMRVVAFVALGILATIGANTADACSFARGYEVAKPPSRFLVGRETPAPRPPHVSVHSLRRGYGVPDGGSCNDAGTLTVRLEGPIDPNIAGYTFRLVDGAFPDSIFPEAVIKPIDLGDGILGFRFVWLDLAQGSTDLASINATVEVRQISNDGAEGDATLLYVLDPGGSSLGRSSG